MNNRINYSGFVGSNFSNQDEPNPDLREWPVALADKPAAPQLDTSRLNKAATEE